MEVVEVPECVWQRGERVAISVELLERGQAAQLGRQCR